MSEVRLVESGVSFTDETIQVSTAFNLKQISSNTTALNKDFIIVTGNSPQVTITLPTSPVIGFMVKLKDATGLADSSPWLVLAPGERINSSTIVGETLEFDMKYREITMTYVSSVVGWST